MNEQTEEQIEGTNIPEFHAMLNAATESLAKGPQVVWRKKANRREFWVAAESEKPADPKAWEKIVTLRATVKGAHMDASRLYAPVRSAAAYALGYFWSRTIVAILDTGIVSTKPEGVPTSKVLVRIIPHPAGFSR